MHGVHCKLTVQVWAIMFRNKRLFDCANDGVSETGLAEADDAGQREPVVIILLVDLKYGFVYQSAWVHVTRA